MQSTFKLVLEVIVTFQMGKRPRRCQKVSFQQAVWRRILKVNFSTLLKLTFILEIEQAKKKRFFFQKRVFVSSLYVLSVLFLLDTLMISRQSDRPHMCSCSSCSFKLFTKFWQERMAISRDRLWPFKVSNLIKVVGLFAIPLCSIHNLSPRKTIQQRHSSINFRYSQ